MQNHELDPDGGPTRTAPGQHASDSSTGSDLASEAGNRAMAAMLGGGIQRAGDGPEQLDEEVSGAIESRRGLGRPLDDETRLEMEGALGHDLSSVRIHTDATAHELSRSVNARAFTSGSDVFFKAGAYDAETGSGRKLLAHELTHTVQQAEGQSGLEPGQVSHPSDGAERDAEAVGEAVSGQASAPSAGSMPAGPAVAREMDDEEPEEGVMPSLEPGVARQAEDEEAEAEL